MLGIDAHHDLVAPRSPAMAPNVPATFHIVPPLRLVHPDRRHQLQLPKHLSSDDRRAVEGLRESASRASTRSRCPAAVHCATTAWVLCGVRARNANGQLALASRRLALWAASGDPTSSDPDHPATDSGW